MGKVVLVTGGAGYVGEMLIMRLSNMDNVSLVITIDKEPQPENLKNIEKLIYIQKNLIDPSWEEEVLAYSPNVVIHCAWQIRELYAEQAKQRKWNLGGSKRVFDFAFKNKSVNRLIHYSTVASYGALPKNSQSTVFKEEDNLRHSVYSYAEEKRLAEKILEEGFTASSGLINSKDFSVALIRPASITGPFGRMKHSRFGLQSALLGSNNKYSSFIKKIIFSFIPVTPKWSRQFVYEEDIVDATILLALKDELIKKYDVFNLAPAQVLLGSDIASISGKKLVVLPPFIIRFVFFVVWHLSRGKVPTAPGSWLGYSFPIVVDGSKITKIYGYNYKMNSREALLAKK